MVTLVSPSTIAVEKMSVYCTRQFCLWIMHSHSMQAVCILFLLSLLWSDQSNLTGINWCYFLIGWCAALCYVFGWWIFHPIDRVVSRSSWAAQCPKPLPTCSKCTTTTTIMHEKYLVWLVSVKKFKCRCHTVNVWHLVSLVPGTWYYQHYWGFFYYTCWNQHIFYCPVTLDRTVTSLSNCCETFKGT